MFEGFRITWAQTLFGGFFGRKVLELGPLKPGHSYMLHQLDAERIDAVEANTRAFLKCLIVKEILTAERIHLMLGDFVEYLWKTSESYDWVVASGVFFHMKDPQEVLDLISQRTSRLLLWTHYYDPHAIDSSNRLGRKFGPPELISRSGVSIQIARYEYQDTLNWSGFCGGSTEYSMWIAKAILLCAHKS